MSIRKAKRKMVKVSEGVKVVRKKEHVLTIDVLGTEYDIIIPADPKMLDEINADGLCDDILHRIYIRDLTDDKRYNAKSSLIEMRHNLRHECIHAFVKECGLANNTSSETSAWVDESVVDWLSLQYDKLGEIFSQAYQILDMLEE